jgi:acyl carrier protein
MSECVREDIRQAIDQHHGAMTRVGQLLFNPGVHAVLLYRLSRWLYLHHLGALALVVGYVNSVLTGAQISRSARIGRGLCIGHPHGVVISANAVIGDYCALVGGNVIAQLYGVGDRPVIGDYFFGGAGAKILGKIHVGDRVRVGANSVVIASVPDHATVIGVPARIAFRRGAPATTGDRRALSHEEAVDRLAALVKSCLRLADPLDSITEDTVLVGEDVGVDSIEMLRLVCAIEEEFHISIDEGEGTLSHFHTVGSLAALIVEASACPRSRLSVN